MMDIDFMQCSNKTEIGLEIAALIELGWNIYDK